MSLAWSRQAIGHLALWLYGIAFTALLAVLALLYMPMRWLPGSLDVWTACMGLVVSSWVLTILATWFLIASRKTENRSF